MESDLTPVNEQELKANRFDLVSRLADDLAHEIKNPLNSIVINLEVLKVRVGRGDAEAALERAHVIEQETRRLHLMIDRLLQLLRPEREEGQSFALDRVLDELLPLIEARVRLARNTFTSACDDSAYLPLRRDTFKFAALNLLTAVHDRLGEGGGTLEVVCEVTGENVRMSINALRDADAPPAPAPDEEYTRSIALASALLEPGGVTLEEDQDGVRVLLPRSNAL